MTELYMWQSLKNACKDQSVVCRNDETVLSNMSVMEVEQEELMKEDQELVNIDDALSHRSCILMEGDKYEAMPVQSPEPAPLENEYGFDTTMRGIIDVTDDQLDTSDLHKKPTDELNFDQTEDLIHETEDISLQSDSGTEGSSIILNVWNEDYEGNPDPEVFDRLLRAKHLPKNIDPQVLLRIKRARIINRIREIEDDESSQGSCNVMWNRMCMPGGFEHDDCTDEGESVHTSNTEADADESIKQESIAGTVDSEVFQFKHPKRSQYALVPDNAYRPGASPTSLVMMLPSPKGKNIELTPMKSFTRDDDSRSRKTCTENEIEFTLQKYDQTPFRIAQLVLSGEKSKSTDEDYDDDASALTEPCLEEQEDAHSTVIEQKFDAVMKDEEDEKDIGLDEFVMKSPRFVEDEDPVDCDRSLSSYSRMKVTTPISDLYKVFTSSDFELQTGVERVENSNASNFEEEFSALTLPAYVKDCAIPDTYADTNESSLEHEDDVLGKSSYETDLVETFGENTEDLDLSEEDPLQVSDVQNDECSELSIIEEHEAEEHILSSDMSYASERETSAVEDSENVKSDDQMSFEESAEHSIDDLANKSAIYERQSSDLFGSIALATQVGNPTMANDDSGEADISEENSDESLGSDLEIAPTMTSQSEGDGVSLNPVSSSYSFVNMTHQENYVHSPIEEQALSKGKNFDESTDELDQPNNPAFVPRSSLVPSDKGIPATGTEESDEMTDLDDRHIDLARTSSSNLNVSDLEEALDIQIQVTSTGSYMSYTTADGEEVVIAIPVEGNVTVPQPNSRYGRIITPEEYERLQSSLIATYTVDSIPEGLEEDLSSVDGEVGESNLDCSDINESFGDENEMNLANSCEDDAISCKHEDMLEKERNANISYESRQEESNEVQPTDDNVDDLVELVEDTLEIIDEPTIANIRDNSIIPDASNFELQRDHIVQEMVENNEEDTLEIIEDSVDAVEINEKYASEIPTIDAVPQSAPQDVEEFSTPQSKIEELPFDDTLVIEETKESSQIKEASIENVVNVESDSFVTAEEDEQHFEPNVETKEENKPLLDSSEKETNVMKRTMKKSKTATPSRKGAVKNSSSLQSPSSTSRNKITKKPTVSSKSGPKLKKKPTTDTIVDDLLALKRSMEKKNRSRKGNPSIKTNSLLDAAMKVQMKTDTTNGRKIRKSVKS
ncbi:predicted protein [Chaetoceros tenuissimus]|uniref:Uncharacterized protein n=1 Tax=Chaetoceros tenuissimus TaxID=426638 RepID=A0AAD3HEQ7_9STRA|nr:predicted protein [Chaetoceros tenuissimus]